ncbi:diguanylate cyclase [Marinomonas mediterranea]|uniref:GGDEF domain-containing protein n=1 Tax=Marinomonas mediterranea TaxID=119864 RepID=UPI00234B439C|nr:GGDEF domain-containing protein [Marinomonas mediterranea]WCN14673.1 diguanylate cyclase [Marinomonas mediterranea]
MSTAQDKLVEALRKTVSRTSMLAEGSDPELDKVLQQVRADVSKTDDIRVVELAMRTIEPFLLKLDEDRLSKAQSFRDGLHQLLNTLEGLEHYQVPINEKKAFEQSLRSKWQSSTSWPILLQQFSELAKLTFTTKKDERSSSLISRLFKKDKEEDKASPQVEEVTAHICHKLIALVRDLQLPSEYENQAEDIISELNDHKDLNHLPILLDEVISLVLVAVGKPQEDLATYLTHLNKQLASINASIVTSYKSQKNLTAHREDFDTSLQKHVEDTNSALLEASDLGALKSLIGQHMVELSGTMGRYREQIKKQEEQATQSITNLKSKVNRMEKDATNMRSRMQQKIAEAMTDSLTNLPNRAAYLETILPLIVNSKKTNKPLCLAVCDIDHFKKINDTWGHLAGDKVLRLVPKQILSAVGKEDLLFRYGGEEFVLLIPASTVEECHAKVEAVRASVEKTPFNVEGQPVSVTISIGMDYLNANDDHESIFARADKHLYEAKESGRNKVVSGKG